MKIPFDKKAQLGETMTWIVATLIIIAVLGISIFAAEALPGFEGDIILHDKKKDFVATQSIVSFLNTEEKANFVREFNDNSNEGELSKFLEVLPAHSGSKFDVSSLESDGGWNFEINDGNESSTVTTSEFILRSDVFPSRRADPFFEIILLYENKLIKFWAECFQGVCK